MLLLRCLAVLCEVKRFAEAELLVDSTLEYYSFYDDRVKRKELEYLGLSAAFLDRNFRKAYNYIRSDKSVDIFRILNKISQNLVCSCSILANLIYFSHALKHRILHCPLIYLFNLF